VDEKDENIPMGVELDEEARVRVWVKRLDRDERERGHACGRRKKGGGCRSGI
jgi:hypothetical protein